MMTKAGALAKMELQSDTGEFQSTGLKELSINYNLDMFILTYRRLDSSIKFAITKIMISHPENIYRSLFQE